MEFIWHDGGRASCGFVGLTGDCVVRSIAIATGELYRDVYDSLSQNSPQSARFGVSQMVYGPFLANRGWKRLGEMAYVSTSDNIASLPKGVVLIQFEPIEDGRNRHGHMTCVIDHTVYDTWNPFEDPLMQISGIWVFSSPVVEGDGSSRARGGRATNNESRLTQREYERILNRFRNSSLL